MPDRPPLLPFGVLGRPHGVRGEITLRPFNTAGEPTLDALPVDVEISAGDRTESHRLIGLRGAGDHYLASLDGITSREAAAALTNAQVALPREALEPLGEGEFFVQDLIGCRAVDTAGTDRGRVRGTYWNGVHDVLTIESEAGEELLIPVVPDFMVEVDVEHARIVIDPHE